MSHSPCGVSFWFYAASLETPMSERSVDCSSRKADSRGCKSHGPPCAVAENKKTAAPKTKVTVTTSICLRICFNFPLLVLKGIQKLLGKVFFPLGPPNGRQEKLLFWQFPVHLVPLARTCYSTRIATGWPLTSTWSLHDP